MELILYVIAGPNGIGKTTATYDLVPRNISVINSDEIAKQVRLSGIAENINTQEYSNRESQKLISENLENRVSFGFETNLCDVETWKFLIGVQKLGYKIHLIFLSTDNLGILNSRIEERTKRGEHYVTPEVVYGRYVTGLKLLNHYFNIPDKIDLIDNSNYSRMLVRKSGNEVKRVADTFPEWVIQNLTSLFDKKNNPDDKAADLNSKEEVLAFYKKKLRKD